MARENFKKVQPGDRLSAERVNELSGIARDQSTKWQGSFTQGRENASSAFPPHAQRIVIVTAVTDQTQLLFECRVRFYNSTASTWETDESQGPFTLDEGSFGNEGTDRESGSTLKVGDLVTAWWDEQREAWIPILTGTTSTSTTCPIGSCVYQAQLVNATTTTDTGADVAPTTPAPIPGWVLISCNCSDPSTSSTTTTTGEPDVPVNDCTNCKEPPSAPTDAEVAAGTLFTTCCEEPTTTTAPPCSGYCIYNWSEFNNEWEVTRDECSEDCQCDNGPQFCGDENCDNVRVGCVASNESIPPPIDCDTTTTGIPTTCAPAPPPGEGDPTVSPGCTSCQWAWGGGGWILIGNGCLNEFCICEGPTSPGNLCQIITTFCEQVFPPTPPQPFCTGSCGWQWDLSGTGLGWFNVGFGCVSNSSLPCTCPEPSFDGSVCGEFTRTACRFTFPSTTAPPGTTTTLCGQPPPPTTTTAVPLPCSGVCRWQWDAPTNQWVTINRDGCLVADGCICTPPARDGLFDCEIVETNCGTTTSTTGPPTTSSSTTTTCGHPGTCGSATGNACSWVCESNSIGQTIWRKTADGCCSLQTPPSFCPQPCPQTGCTIGSVTHTECVTDFRCQWTWNGSSWDLTGNRCECNEGCQEPPADPSLPFLPGSVSCIPCDTTTSTSTSTTSTSTTPPPIWCVRKDQGSFCLVDGCSAAVNFNCVFSGPFDTVEECLDSGCLPTTTTTTFSPCTCADIGLTECGNCTYECRVAEGWTLISNTCGVGNLGCGSIPPECGSDCSGENVGAQKTLQCCCP